MEPTLDDALLQELAGQLRSRARTLRAALAAVEADRLASGGITPPDTVEDSADRSERVRLDAVRQAEEERDSAELHDIAAALERVERGDYGRCIDCDAPIGLPRLRARPTATRCLRCQEAHELLHPPGPRFEPTPGV